MTQVITTAVTERAANVAYLVRHIPDLKVVWDVDRNAMHTFIRACHAAKFEPAIRTEDDLILTVDFREKAEAIIAEHGDTPIQFFSRSLLELPQGSRMRPGSTFTSNVCFYLPAGMSEKIAWHHADWIDRIKHPTGYDLLMADYFRKNKISYWTVLPPLAQHMIGISAIDTRRPKKRISLTFQDPELDGLWQ
jgi:hypothetical protein